MRVCSADSVQQNSGLWDRFLSESHIPAEDRYNAMPFQRCGGSGLRLPAISLGAAFDSIAGGRDESSAREAVFAAFDLGVTHFDLANNYGSIPGNAELLLGGVIRDLPRDELIISTKAGFAMWPGPYGEGLSRKHIIASVDKSLRRLGLDYVDIFYAHMPDSETPIEETVAALDHVVRQGKALYVGVANFSSKQYDLATAVGRERGLAPITIHQTPYNILARSAEKDLFPSLIAHGTGCIAFYVLGQGVLSGKYLDGAMPPDSRVAKRWGEVDRRVGLAPHALEQIHRLSVLAAERGQTLAQMCIAWVLGHPAVTSALLGVTSIEQIRENVSALRQLGFSEEECGIIDRISPSPIEGNDGTKEN